MNASSLSGPGLRDLAVRVGRSRALRVVLVLLAAAAGALAIALHTRPNVNRYGDLRLVPDSGGSVGARPGLRVTFFGVSTLLITDGQTSFMTDGFFSRPGPLRTAFGRIEPDLDRIGAALRRAKVERLAAVIALHSHYDHALDSAVVAQKTGAELVGSLSTAAIGRAHGLPEHRIRLVRDGEVIEYGDFRVTVLASAHVPTRLLYPGLITSLPSPAARVGDYRMGDNYALLVAHGRRRLLVQGGAGFVEGILEGREADVVYLSIGQLGKQSEQYMKDYWQHVVRAVGAKRVVAIHWDDFFRPLDEPLVASPWLIDRGLHRAMDFLRAADQDCGKEQRVDIRLPVEWVATDPYDGLPEPTRAEACEPRAVPQAPGPCIAARTGATACPAKAMAESGPGVR